MSPSGACVHQNSAMFGHRIHFGKYVCYLFLQRPVLRISKMPKFFQTLFDGPLPRSAFALQPGATSDTNSLAGNHEDASDARKTARRRCPEVRLVGRAGRRDKVLDTFLTKQYLRSGAFAPSVAWRNGIDWILREPSSAKDLG